ncbi:unnamed protein product [Symbiodinium sp. KB8]|nr:unnamed protein product [Symbiodinium sp. KB8]
MLDLTQMQKVLEEHSSKILAAPKDNLDGMMKLFQTETSERLDRWTGAPKLITHIDQRTLAQMAAECTKPKPGKGYRGTATVKAAMRRTEVPKQWEGGGHDSVMEDEISGMVLVPESVKMKTVQEWCQKQGAASFTELLEKLRGSALCPKKSMEVLFSEPFIEFNGSQSSLRKKDWQQISSSIPSLAADAPAAEVFLALGLRLDTNTYGAVNPQSP